MAKEAVRLIVQQVQRDDVFEDLARLNARHRPGIKAGQLMRLRTGSGAAILVARGAPGNDTTGIWLDHASRQALRVRVGEAADFHISAAGLVESAIWSWHASDPARRISSQLGLLSLGLGLIGLGLGILSVALTVC